MNGHVMMCKEYPALDSGARDFDRGAADGADEPSPSLRTSDTLAILIRKDLAAGVNHCIHSVRSLL